MNTATWALIMSLNVMMPEHVATAMLYGFSTEKECIVAGKTWHNSLTAKNDYWNDSAVFTCVKQTTVGITGEERVQ
jgi:hypothetical protein